MNPRRYVVPLAKMAGRRAEDALVVSRDGVVELTVPSSGLVVSPTEAAQIGQALQDAARDAGAMRARRQR